MRRRSIIAGSMGLGLTGLLGTGPARAADRFVVPAEDAPHDRTFMQWPVSRRVYPPRAFRTAVQDTIIDLANIVAAFEPVTLLAAADHHAVLRARLSGAVTLWDIPTEDLWCRDTGPIFAVNSAGDLAVQHIQFNGWGEKQVNRRGSQIAANVAARLSVPLLPTGLTGEGGGVEQDGHGLLMAHESSWVNANRNPGLTKAEVTDKLLSAYGADRMVWAPGLCGEDITDYHIDSLARFTGPGQVLMNLPLDPDLHDPFHQTARQTHDVLKDAGLTVDVIPEPVRRRVQSWDFVASYVNFYVCNGAVIAAEFGDPDTDAQARDALSAAYPGREIVMINADVLGEIGGGIHCATQQMPAV